MLNSDFQTMVENRLPPPLRNMLHKIPGDCLEIPNKYPDLVGKIDAIYVQNLEHFFNPIQHQDFLRLLSILLTQNGRAFLVSHTLDPQVAIPSNPVFSLYKEHKEKEIYPGFMKVTGSSYSLKSGISIGSLDVAEATRPEQSTSCSTTTISCQDAEITFNGKKEMGKFLTQVVISNFYTPTIYKNAISTHKSLTMVATYFMDRHGNKHEKFGDSTSMTFAAAILEKNSH